MTAPLVPCESCARHLRADEPRCPFCDAPHTPRALAYAPLPRVSRAALAALGAVLTVVPAVAVLTSNEAQAQRGVTVVPAYGVPPPVQRAPPTRAYAAARRSAVARAASSARRASPCLSTACRRSPSDPWARPSAGRHSPTSRLHAPASPKSLTVTRSSRHVRRGSPPSEVVRSSSAPTGRPARSAHAR